MDDTYLIKDFWTVDRRVKAFPIPSVKVRFDRRQRDTGQRIAGLRVVEDAGADKKKVRIAPGGDHFDSSMTGGFPVALTPAAIHKMVRRLRPQEAESIEVVEAEIVRLEDELAATRLRRRALLAEAFTRGHVVTVKELREAAEANQ